jgi:Fe-S oxidoreductase
LIYFWAKLASLMPDLANLAARAPGLSHVLKFAAGYAQQRKLPLFATQTFREWWNERRVHPASGERVILWADTFTNYFQPEVAKAAVETLEYAGFHVEVPRQSLCCGRPLYDYGMLDRARTKLLEILRALRPAIEDGIPVVVLEPGCFSVFRDEMTELLWGNVDAVRLKGQVFLLSEFLERKGVTGRLPKLMRRAYVQGHCHHKAVAGMKDEKSVLEKMGAEYHEFDAGCCGMAGAFGYEAGDHYDVSMACAERALLPAIEKTETDALVVADGFSCREQIEQTTPRRALHLGQVVQMAIREQSGQGARREFPERDFPGRKPVFTASRAVVWGAVGALAVGLALRRK